MNPFWCNRSVVSQSIVFQASTSLCNVSHKTASTASSTLCWLSFMAFLSIMEIAALCPADSPFDSAQGRLGERAHLTRLFLPASDRLSSFFIRRPPSLRLALIPQLLPLSQRQFNLYFAILEVHPHRDQRQPFLLRLPDQLADFFFVHEQLAIAQRRVVVD